jgi:hypothetical protein
MTTKPNSARLRGRRIIGWNSWERAFNLARVTAVALCPPR